MTSALVVLIVVASFASSHGEAVTPVLEELEDLGGSCWQAAGSEELPLPLIAQLTPNASSEMDPFPSSGLDVEDPLELPIIDGRRPARAAAPRSASSPTSPTSAGVDVVIRFEDPAELCGYGLCPTNIVSVDFYAVGPIDAPVELLTAYDIVAVRNGRDLEVWDAPVHSGAGCSAPPAGPWQEVWLPSRAQQIGLGDVDGDGWVDLLVADETRMLSLYRNGDGSLETPAVHSVDVGIQARVLLVADVDANGSADVIVCDETVCVISWGGPGAQLGQPETLPFGDDLREPGFEDQATPPVILVSDIDGDGSFDLALLVPEDETVIILRQDAPGHFALYQSLDTAAGPVDLLAADLAGLGTAPELVVVNRDHGSLSVFGNADGFLGEQSWSPLLVQTQPSQVKVVWDVDIALPSLPRAVELLVYGHGSLDPVRLDLDELFSPSHAELSLPYRLGTVLAGYEPDGRDDLIGFIEALPTSPAPSVDCEVSEISLLVVSVPEGEERNVRDAIAQNPDASYAEVDYFAEGSTLDPLFTCQWGLEAIGVEAAWEETIGSLDVALAVLDSGVDRSRPDLDGVVRENPGEIPGDSIDNDGNGVIDDVWGVDLIDGECEELGLWKQDDPDFTDASDLAHGSAVAEIAVAVRDNDHGIAGVATASVERVKVLDEHLKGPVSAVAHGIVYAVLRGAHVVNMSLGTPSSSATLEAAVQYADSQGLVLIAATGNCDAAVVEYPARYEEVLGVGAIRHDLEVCPFSNRGWGLDLVAPGVGVLSAAPLPEDCDDCIIRPSDCAPLDAGCDEDLAPDCCRTGTSFATAHASGVACLLKALEPTISPAQVRAWLRAGAQDLGEPGPGPASGMGLLQALPPIERLRACQEGDHDSCEPDVSPPALAPPPFIRCLSMLTGTDGVDEACGGTGLLSAFVVE